MKSVERGATEHGAGLLPLHEQVVVITGASSGIGRETALRFGREGARVVLAARNRSALEEVASDVVRAGGGAHVVVADVGEWGQVQRLADEAINRYGRFDTWVNNAGVSVYGTVEQTPLDEIERVVQVDLMGQVYGIKAALPQLTRQRRGAIVCVGSGLSIRAVPLQAPYCAAKHGLRGFVDALRLELRRDHPGLHVALIMPASVNTPFFDHARSHLGVRPAPFPPVYEPASVAEAIVASAQRQVRDVYVGGASKLLATAQAVSPSLVDSGMMLRDLGFELQRSDRPDHGDSNLYEPSEAPNAAQGTWSGRSIGESLYTRTVELRPRRQRLLALGALAGAVLMARRTG